MPMPEPPASDDDDFLDVNQFLEEEAEEDGVEDAPTDGAPAGEDSP